MLAIQGHPTRGKEVIQIFESLGGKNVEGLTGTYKTFYYVDDKNEIGDDHKKNFPSTYKLYTLEEFEQEFPFKIGDEVIVLDYNNKIGTIVTIKPCGPILAYFIKLETGDGVYRTSKSLKLYKEMKEERNITLTLDKAKEWYKKGGELKEIALQAFTEQELNPLPRSWEEFATNHARMGYYISSDGKPLMCAASGKLSSPHVCPSKESARAHLAMIQLEQLRNCWRQGWEPTTHEAVYAIKFSVHGLGVYNFVSREFLSFPTKEMAEEFLKCFRNLIELAGDLI